MSEKEHEIANILGILVGNAQMLAAEDLGPDAKEMADDISMAATRLGLLLRARAEADLLQVASQGTRLRFKRVTL